MTNCITTSKISHLSYGRYTKVSRINPTKIRTTSEQGPNKLRVIAGIGERKESRCYYCI